MLKVGFAFNFNIQRCEIEVGDEEQIIRKGYEQLLKLFIKHNLKADCFVSGFSSGKIHIYPSERITKNSSWPTSSTQDCSETAGKKC